MIGPQDLVYSGLMKIRRREYRAATSRERVDRL
jgi:hypothetical protein